MADKERFTMVSSKLIRWSGLLIILQSALFLLWWVLLGTLLPINVQLVDQVLDSNWMFVNVLGLIAAVLVPLCLVGLYARQVEKVGILGLLGFLLASIGSILFASLQFEETIAWPVFAVHAPALLDVQGPLISNQAFSTIYLIMGLLYIVGFILFGIATMRAGVLTRWGALLLIISAPLFGAGLFVPVFVRTIGAVLYAVGFAWLGYTLWRDKGKRVA